MSGHINLSVIYFVIPATLGSHDLVFSDEPLCRFYQCHYLDPTRPCDEENTGDPSLSVSRLGPEEASVTVGGVNISLMRSVQVNCALCVLIFKLSVGRCEYPVSSVS